MQTATSSIVWKKHDGGRAAAGLGGPTSDCVVRAIAIATGVPYKEVHDELGRRNYAFIQKRNRYARSLLKHGINPDYGNVRPVYEQYLKELGWVFVPTMGVGTGCKVHLKPDELPEGRIICRVSKHICAVVDGVLYDTYDCSRYGTRCVYGYYKKEKEL